jgi:hypothetical protein
MSRHRYQLSDYPVVLRLWSREKLLCRFFPAQRLATFMISDHLWISRGAARVVIGATALVSLNAVSAPRGR